MAFQKDYSRRNIIPQEFTANNLTVGTSPVPISQASQMGPLQALYEAIEICVPTTAANSVWFGGSNIAVAQVNGAEIPIGSTRFMKISNERQLYELQAPLVDGMCGSMMDIQFKVWDVNNMYLVASASTVVGIILYKGNFF